MTDKSTHEIGFLRLKATLEKLKNLDESAFDYSEFVRKFDNEKVCPTIGCVAGYLPMWFTDTPFHYVLNFTGDYELSFNCRVDYGAILSGLIKYFQCSSEIIKALFFGEHLENYIEKLIPETASLREVQLRFQIVIDLIETSTISWN